MDWDTYGFVKASKYRTEILISLTRKPKTPSELAEDSDFHLSHVSNTLTELSERNLVVCLTEDRTKGRIYDLTDEGEEISEMLSQ